MLAILEWLLLLRRRGRHVQFCWVPAYVGVVGNELADALAKAAASRPLVRCYPVPASDVRPGIRDAVRACWQGRWDAVGANKLRSIRQELGDWAYGGLSRRWETALVRLRIGHSRLTHGFLMEGVPPPFCDDCLVPLTVRHLLVECPSLGDLRRRYLSGYRAGDGSYRLSSVLGESACSLEGGTLSFVEEAGLLPHL